jgi:hypothetical protein
MDSIDLDPQPILGMGLPFDRSRADLEKFWAFAY